MGKKRQRDREEKREEYYSKRSRESRKNKMIAGAILGVVAVIVGYAGYEFATMTENTPDGPENAGVMNSEHVHAGILVKIFKDKFDFSTPAYQVKTPWIHFEGQNGDTIHRHATGVTLGYLFDSLSIEMDNECFVFPNEREYCTNETYSLKFFVNGEKVDSIRDYVVQEDDRVLVSYGSETDEELDEQIQEAQNLVLDIR